MEEQKIANVKKTNFALLWNVQEALQAPLTGKSYLTRGDIAYFHYGCDGYQDFGWGCAYRTLQSMCSWILCKRGSSQASIAVPTLTEIQQTLVRIGDKAAKFVGSRDWIGALEVFYVVDALYDVSCKILHVPRSEDLKLHANVLKEYFESFGGFVMMGGDIDAASKGIAGVHITEESELYLLVVDPHFVGAAKSAHELIDRGYVCWRHTSEFVDSSFYNFCLPQLK